MPKLYHITRSLSRTQNKRYENYVITRIFHLLNDLEIKIITQQHVSRPDGKRALTDLYFPQFGLHVEVDEPFHLEQKEKDLVREADVVNATQHRFRRVDISKGLTNIHEEIDSIVNEIKELKKTSNNFVPWEPEKENNPETYIQKGSMSIDDNCAFFKMTDAASCFGKKFVEKSIWKGGVLHPVEQNVIIWFPKLYPNGEWLNSISNDEDTIIEKMKLNDDNSNFKKIEEHILNTISSPYQTRIVLAKVKSPLGDVMYRFRGVYQLDKNKSGVEEGLIWIRVSKEVKTYNNYKENH